jgi:sigma54-dependent transcription regulator
MKSTPTTSTNVSAPVADNGPDCERVNTVLDQLVEGHAPTAEDEDYLVHHADDCSPCFDDIKKQRIFIEFLGQRLSRKSSPDHLPKAIMARVQAEVV